jgi:hypothetical protein
VAFSRKSLTQLVYDHTSPPRSWFVDLESHYGESGSIADAEMIGAAKNKTCEGLSLQGWI